MYTHFDSIYFNSFIIVRKIKYMLEPRHSPIDFKIIFPYLRLATVGRPLTNVESSFDLRWDKLKLHIELHECLFHRRSKL